ncbi:MAG: dimethylhistidine N-methyltransferase [Rhodothermales bacterium]|jgi:dimethylhistidine N-methyltransferase
MGDIVSPIGLFIDAEPKEDSVLDEVVAGLTSTPRRLPPKLFYDAEGSRLFDAICELEEYYPTRTEAGIMSAYVDEMVDAVGPGAALVEYGSGSSLKTEILLSALGDLVAYLPIDISRDHLLASANRIGDNHPGLQVLPVCADYTLHIPGLTEFTARHRTVVYFPGSTIGNFDPPHAKQFLAGVATLVGPGGGMLIGVDLKKHPARLEAAYDDALGVTAAFNLNMLRHINARLGEVFDVGAFRHRAVWNAACGRVEMHLVASRAQEIRMDGRLFEIAAGESIVTEHSYKYTVEGFRALALSAGFDSAKVWTDKKHFFSIHYLVAR